MSELPNILNGLRAPKAKKELFFKQKQDVKEIAHFLALPTGQMMPGAAQALSNIYGKGRPQSANSKRKAKIAKMTTGQLKRVLGKQVTGVCLSDADLLRLKELDQENRADAAREAAGGGAKGRRRARRRKGAGAGGAAEAGREGRADGDRDGAGDAPVHPAHGLSRSIAFYEAENKKLRRVIREKRPAELAHVIRSHAMEGLFEIERRQAHAVMVIQRAYRRYRRLCDMWEYLRRQRMATRIQKMVRGAVTRVFVARWFLRKAFLATLAQACARRAMVCRHWEEQCMLEGGCAVDIQRLVRGRLARQRCERIRRIHAAAKIQRLWRGVVGRARADRRWLNMQVTRMQKCCKGHLGREAYRAKRAAATKAALNVQRIFRGSEVRQERNELLYERETKAREMALALLRKEDEHTAEALHKIEKRRDRRGLAAEVKTLQKKLHKCRVEVQGLEFDLEKLQVERGAMSPRAIKQGWKEELDKNKVEFRQKVTAAKLEALFDVEQPLREAEENLEEETLELTEAEWEHEQVQIRRHAELVGLWNRESERKWSEEAITKRRLKAAQRRRWRIKFFTKTGKPDKLRRDGHPWDERAFAGDEKATFYMGDAKLLTGITTDPAKIGTSESLQQTYDAVHLQSTMNQMQQYGTILKPLMDNMNQFQKDVEYEDASAKARREARLEAEAREAEEVAASGKAGAVAGGAAGGDGAGAGAAGAGAAGTALAAVAPEPKKFRATRKGRRPRNAYASQIPWTLLDELDSEKYKLEQEREARLASFVPPVTENPMLSRAATTLDRKEDA
eukprot:g3791.t1